MMNAMIVNFGKNVMTQKKKDNDDKLMEKKDPFKTERDSDSYLSGKLVGGYVPLPVSQRLRLLAVYNETSIQKTLQQIIIEWTTEKEPENSMIETLADRAYMEWKRRLNEYKIVADTNSRRKAYITEIKERLRRRKLSHEYIEMIAEKLIQKMEL